MAGNPGAYDSQGMRPPALDPILLASSVAGPAMVGMGRMAPKMMASEAGAIFPEQLNMPIPKDRAAIQELRSILPESQANYLRNQATSDWHASNYDWPRVLEDKWRLLTHAGGN